MSPLEVLTSRVHGSTRRSHSRLGSSLISLAFAATIVVTLPEVSGHGIIEVYAQICRNGNAESVQMAKRVRWQPLLSTARISRAAVLPGSASECDVEARVPSPSRYAL